MSVTVVSGVGGVSAISSGGTGPAGPNSISTGTGCPFAAKSVVASQGTKVVPMSLGVGFNVVGNFPLTQYTASVQIGTAACSLSGLLVGNGSNVSAIAFPGGGTTFLRDDGTFAAPPSGGGMTVGNTVTGGTAGRVLYVGAGPVLAEDDGTAALTVGPRTVQGNSTVRGTAGNSNGTAVFTVRSRLNDRNMLVVGDNDYTAMGGLRLGSDQGSGFVTKMGTTNETEWRFAADAFFTWTGSSAWASGTDTGLKRAAARVVGLTDSGGGGGTLSSPPLTPAQITADQNDYAPGAARFYRLSTNASRNLTGLSVSQVDGQECEVWNVGANAVVLKHQNAGSSAANRFVCTGAADVTLAADEVALLRYDATSGRWRVRKV